MSALNAALCKRGIILWLAAVLLLASRSTHSAPVYDQDTTEIAEYEGATGGCYFNFQRYHEGDRIVTSEPCLNCTCHNRMLMCYLKVCPFTKAIGQDCTVEKRPDQCCPVITCPEVPVQLLTSTTSTPDSTEVGFHDNYGCHVDDRFYPDGAMLAVDHHNPCELCYCIRNRTTCVMQECTLQVAGCEPVYQPGVCCPIKYNCEYEEESSTTVGPTPGLIITTTLPPGVLPQCYYEDKVYEDGELIYSTQPCQHCYCFRGEIACAVQNCGTPMQAHGKNCTALPPPEGECCPTTYQCDEEEEGGAVTLPEEQYPEQVQHDQLTESPILIEQEDQQIKGEHPQEESLPNVNVSQASEGEEEGTIEHITLGHIPSSEKPEEESATLPIEETETTAIEKEFTPSQEYVTAISPTEVTTKQAVVADEISSEIETAKMPTTIKEIEEDLVTKVPTVELSEATSISEGLKPKEEVVTTEHIPEEHISTEEGVIEKEHGISSTTEKEQPTEPPISEETQTGGIITSEQEETSSHEGVSTQVTEEISEAEKPTEEEPINVTKIPEKPEISTEIIEKPTSPVEVEESSISTIPESVTEHTTKDEGEVKTTPNETLATETESSIKEEIATSTEQTEKELHSTESTVTEQIQSTEISGPPKTSPAEEEQKPVIKEGEMEQRPEEESTSSELAITEEEKITVGGMKEEAGLTESSIISEEPITTEHTEEEVAPEIPAQGPTGIPIPERSPEQKAEDQSGYHVTEVYHDITRPEVKPDNLMTESPQKISTTSLPQEQETTLVPSKEIAEPTEEGTEAPIERITTPSHREPEIITSSDDTKVQSTPAVTEIQTSTEFSTTTVAHEEHVSEEKTPEESNVTEESKTEIPHTEIQPTEETVSSEELPTKGPGVEESGETVSGEEGKKEMPTKEQPTIEEAEIHPPVVIESEVIPETSTMPVEHEHSTTPSDLEEEQATEGEHITTVIPSTEQSTHVPQVEEKETEIVPIEKEKPIEEHITEQPTESSITPEEEEELQTKPISKEQTTEVIKITGEAEEKPTMQTPTVEEEKTKPPEQYPTEKISEETTVTESHDVQETEIPIIDKETEKTEGTKDVSTESIEQQTEMAITEKEPSDEIIKIKPTEITGIEQTELPSEHATESNEIEKEVEEKISVPVSTEKIQTEIPETGFTETSTIEKEIEKAQTESPISEEYIPSQSSIPSDRKEDQEPIEPSEKEKGDKEHITQKPSVEEEEVTETVLPEEKPVEAISTTEIAGISETQPELTSEQQEKVTIKSSEQEPVTEEQPEMHVRKETESPIIHEEPSTTPTSEESTASKESVDVSKTTEVTLSEDITTPALTSTELPGGIEESTKHEDEVPIEKEITTSTEFVPLESQPETHEHPSEEESSQEVGEIEKHPEISTEENAISETPKVPVTEEQPQKPEEQEIVTEKITETPIHEEHSTLAPTETPEVKISTEKPLKEIPEYSTEIPEEIPIEKESTSEIPPRPSGIPGEGNCLVEGQSYNNNSAVPPANACQISCRCISSIVQCELVQCPAPPTHLPNCTPVHTNGESCCPMYACDSAPTAELESDSHKVEPHIPETEEDKKTISPTEISTEASVTEITGAKEFSTVAGEISTPKLQPAEVTAPSEEEVELTATTTLKSVEPIYEQPTTVEQSIEQHPEEHTISPVPEISQESVSQVPEEKEHVTTSVPEEITEGKISEKEGITESAITTEQPQEEKETSVNDEEQSIITSTHPHENESSTISHKEEEVTTPSVTEEKETSAPIEIEASTSVEKEGEVTTIASSEEKEITTERPKLTEEEGIEEQHTFKPIEELEKEQPEEEKVHLIPTSEEPITVEEHEISTKLEEASVVTEELPAKSEIPEGSQTVEPIEHETTSVPEIQSTTEHIPKIVIKQEEKEQEVVTSTEGEQALQTEKPESETTKLPGIAPSEIETEEPIVPIAESTTLIHDHTVTEKIPTEEHMTVKSMEASTEESTEKLEISTETHAEEEPVTVPVLPVEIEIPGDKIAKPIEESIPEVPHKETTEPATEMEHTEKHTVPPIAEHEGEPSITKLPEEEPFETESPIITEQPAKTTELEEISTTEAEHEKSTESSAAHESESTQISIEEHPEVTPEIESHTPELHAEEHIITEKIPTTSTPIQEEIGEQPVTSIIKESSVSEAETETSVIPEVESEAPSEEEHITPIEEQTPKSTEHPIEEQTAAPSEDETTEGDIFTEEATSESVTSQEEHVTKKIESAKPETELPGLEEQQTVIPDIHKEEEESEIMKETPKEEPVTVSEVAGANKKDVTEETIKAEAITPAGTTIGHPSIEEHTEQEIDGTKVYEPTELETTTASKEYKPEEEDQVTSEPSLPEHPVSEEATSITPEEHTLVPVETKEKEGTHEPEYQTTLSPVEEVSKLTIEAVEAEKVPSEEESAMPESTTERPEEHVTKISAEVSPTEKPVEVSPEAERPAEPEQETESSEQEQGETSTKASEGAATEGKLPEEAISVEMIPEVEEKQTEIPAISEEEEVHSTISTPVETTSIHEEEEPSTTKLQPSETPLPSEQGIPVSEKIPLGQPEEGEEIHPAEPEEGHPEEPQFTTEHAFETPITKTEEHTEMEQPEISSEAAVTVEGPIKISGESVELPEENITAPAFVTPGEPEIPISPEEVPQPTEISVEEHVTKIQPIPTELPAEEITEEIPEEEAILPQEGEEIGHPHIDHYPEAATKPETDFIEFEQTPEDEHHRPINRTTERPYRPSFPEQRPQTTLAPHIPDYPDQFVHGEDNPHFPVGSGGYQNPDDDYDEDDQVYGPGTCRYGGKVYVSAQQIPRDDPCDFCFCFRSDIICLQQSCPPPIPGCHEEPISGFCCPRYECPVSMATTVNLTTTTTTTTTMLPPHFPAHAYKGAARRSGCQIRGQSYRVGEIIKSASGPCLHCTCGGDGNMKCDPRVCSPEPMLRQMIAAATSKRRR